MIVNRFVVTVLVSVYLVWHVNAYIEKRSFRDRSKIACRLQKNCKFYEEWDDEYRVMIPLANLTNVQPENYLVRFPFYILAERDAYVVFSETQNPDWLVDSVYEIAYGGWENKRTTLSRKKADEGLAFSYTDDILNKNCPLKAFVEITTAGIIRIYIEHSLTPLVEFRDPNPLKIAYVGFGSYKESLARFFYDCRGEEAYTPEQLVPRCEETSTQTKTTNQNFVPIESNKIDDSDDLLNLPVFIAGKQDAHILVSSDNSSVDKIRNGYEIVVGDRVNRRVVIHSIHNGNMQTLADVRRGDIFLRNETLNTLIKISKYGKIELFSKHDHTQYKLLASVKDIQYSQIPLSYASFTAGSDSNINYFYNCKTVAPYIDTQLATKYAPVGHPLLLEDPNFDTPTDKRNWLTGRCKSYNAEKYEYLDFIPLSAIKESTAPGYQVRLAFYAQASRNAHVLLSRTATPNLAEDNVYEFIIGGWVNSRVVVRRKKSDQVLQQVFVSPILSAQSPTKFIIEVANSGNIRLYAENNKLEPIASVFDPVVLPVKYVSFCAYDNLARFYYDCGGERPQQ